MLPYLVAVFAFAGYGDRPVRIDGEECHPRRLLVKVAPGQRAPLELTNVRTIREFPEIGWVVVENSSGDLASIRAHLARLPGVVDVRFDRAARPAYDPNDPMYPDMWHYRNLHVPEAWDLEKGRSGVVVAVIDTGVKVDHEDLAANVWRNPGEIAGNGIDDDHNGYVDDVNGYDFAYGDGDPDDVHGHGTACAGLVAAVQDNALGVTGVAPRCKVMALKAANNSGYFYDSANIGAYLYAANMGAKVLSMSFYSDQVSPAERDALQYCSAHGVLPVAAAGNDSTVYPFYPGAYENVLSVAATVQNDTKAGFSDHGSWVDVAAPGVSLRSTSRSGGYTTGFGGTSGACPQVAGIAALLFSAKPGATPNEVRTAIEDTATLLDQAPYGEFSNYGLANARSALERLLGLSPAVPRPPLVRWVNSFGPGGPRGRWTARIYGRGFLDGKATVTVRGRAARIVGRYRNYLDAASEETGPVKVYVGRSLVAVVTPPLGYRACWPLVEASTPENGASLTGGFRESLAADAAAITVTRRGDNRIVVHGTFRRVPGTESLKLVVRSRYIGTTTGTEEVQLYDWSTASYPYGSFVTLGSGAVTSTMTTRTYDAGPMAKYGDDEGTVYFRIVTSDNLESGATLALDQVLLVRG
ncbi:MAG: S8 family serine peptidase [Fimbriimonadaceae bacterium]|nr:S8 family serine peptidase [Fimbriimonadaceae bacterium]